MCRSKGARREGWPLGAEPAWRAKVAGAGHRAIAAQLDRPVSIVRRWRRRLVARAEALRVIATRWVYELDPNAGGIDPAGSPLADALEALGSAVAAAVRRICPRAPWEVAVALTGGLVASLGRVKGARPGVRRDRAQRGP